MIFMKFRIENVTENSCKIILEDGKTAFKSGRSNVNYLVDNNKGNVQKGTSYDSELIINQSIKSIEFTNLHAYTKVDYTLFNNDDEQININDTRYVLNKEELVKFIQALIVLYVYPAFTDYLANNEITPTTENEPETVENKTE